MTFINKIILWALLLVAAASIGYVFALKGSFFKKNEEVNSTVVMEKMKTVMKLVTVEAQLSELYSHKDYYSYDFSPFRKQAIIRVTGKVSAGYDFDKLQINYYNDKKQVVVKSFPKPEILSVDHNLDYYDVTEGLFNSFAPADFNKMNNEAKQKITTAALKSNILVKAEQQKSELIKVIRMAVESAGYKLVIIEDTNQPLR